MNSNELLRQLRTIGPVEFANTRLFDAHAWCFPTMSGSEYEDVKSEFAAIFRNSPSDIAIVGSAKYGYSMAPQKAFRPFQPNDDEADPSDLDLVVVSKALFNSTWQRLRQAHFNQAIDAKKLYQGDVFRRFIMVGTDEYSDTKYLRDLMLLLDQARKIATTKLGITQIIKIRVYSSWSDAKSYHIWSLQRLGEQHGIQ
jgi:hypothetical protein